jgi:5-methylcytosine-specific restriction endonuclease McrA
MTHPASYSDLLKDPFLEIPSRIDDWKRDAIHKARRRIRIAQARDKGSHTIDEWNALKIEFEMRCVRCLEPSERLERDHIVPIYQGGSDGIDNIQPLCARCNCQKGSETINWKQFRRNQ